MKSCESLAHTPELGEEESHERHHGSDICRRGGRNTTGCLYNSLRGTRHMVSELTGQQKGGRYAIGQGRCRPRHAAAEFMDHYTYMDEQRWTLVEGYCITLIDISSSSFYLGLEHLTV